MLETQRSTPFSGHSGEMMTEVRPKHRGSSFHQETPEIVSHKKKEKTYVMSFPLV